MEGLTRYPAFRLTARCLGGVTPLSSTSMSHRKGSDEAGVLSHLAVLHFTGSANWLSGRTREDYEVCAKNAAVASTGPCLAVDKADDDFDVSEVV